MAARLSDDAQRLATRGMVWVAALSLAVAGWLLWQRGDAALRLAGSELRGELAAGLEGLHGGQSEMVRHGRVRQAAQDGPGSLAATIVSADLAEYQKTHPAVTGIWLLDDSANVVVQQLGGATAGSAPGLPARVHAMAQAAMLTAGLQTGWHQDASHRQLLLAQPVRFNGSRQIDGALVSAVSIDALLQPLQARLEPSMRVDVLTAAAGGLESPRAGTRTATWPIQLRSAPQGHSHALTLQVSQPWWFTLWPTLWLAAAYALVGTLLVMWVRRRVLAQALQAVQPLQALRDAAAQVAEHGLVDIPEMSVQSLLDGGGEVQDLASSFADMLERLFKAQMVLEQTVASRTAELTLAKGRLDSTLAHLADGDIDGVPAHLPRGWSWGYRSMTTVKGLFTAGDGVGASGHKFSSGSHAEGRLAAKAMVKFALDHKDWTPELDTDPAELAEQIYKPVRHYLQHKDYTTAIDVNPHYITPKMLQFRLQKIMDEYVAGVATYYNTNDVMLKIAEEKLELLKEDAAKMRAKDLHELLRAWENYHRILTAEAHMKHIQFREESRYPGFYYRTDKNFVDEQNWHVFVNSVYDKDTRQWTCFKRRHVDLVDKSKLFKPAAH